MHVWVARDKASEWKVIDAFAARGELPFRLVMEAVSEPLMPTGRGRSKTPDQVIDRLCDRLAHIARFGRVLVDLENLMLELSGADVARLADRMAARFISDGSEVVPVVRTSRPAPLAGAILNWARRSGTGLAIRTSGVTSLPEKSARVAQLAESSALPADIIDLIADAEDLPSHVPLVNFANALPLSRTSRSWSVVAGSFPAGIAELSADIHEHILERTEWLSYVEQLPTLVGQRIPAFGDYATQHARYLPSKPFAPSPSVRYSTADSYVVLRGRRNLPNAHAQFIGHARFLRQQPYFCEIVRTSGDEYVERIAVGSNGTGNGTTWREASLSRHVSLVVAQVMALPAVPV